MKILLINPKPDCPCLFGEEFLLGTALIVADNTTPTVAACIPKEIEVSIIDERVDEINYDIDVDWVGITGKLSQQLSLKRIAEGFKSKGKKILIGGAFIARFSEIMPPYCDIIVKGEIEEIAGELFHDILANNYRKEYVGSRPNPLVSPIPRWDLYPIKKTHAGSIQITRGCPFGCDFCDVIQASGREVRSKSIEQVLAELNVLYHDCNFTTVMITDDNIVADKDYATKLFKAIAKWREGKNISFIVQTPAILAQNEELLSLCSKVGIINTYIGIESFDNQVLESVHKKHNIKMAPNDTVNKFIEYGIAPSVGIILGFDQHTKDIFDTTYNECMKLSTPIVALWTLIAFPGTPFHRRFEKEGRIKGNIKDLSGYPWHTNIIPKHMTVNELGRGVHKLFNRLYEPEAFKTRLINTISKLKQKQEIKETPFAYTIFKHISRLGEEERELCKYLIRNHKDSISTIFNFLAGYAQARYLCKQEYIDI